MKKILDNVLTVLLVIVLVFMSVLSIMLIVSASNDGVASAFGYAPITLYDTKSMEPFFGANDLIIVKKQDASQLKEGDIISFWGFVDAQKCIITHRIVEVKQLEDGTYAYQTQGDNRETNPMRDQDPMNEFRQPDIYPEDIIGVYQFKIAGFGNVLNFIKSPTGILVCMVIPLALIFLWQLVRVIKMAMVYHRETVAMKNTEMSEEEKQRVIAQFLREQQEKQAAAATTDEAPSADE